MADKFASTIENFVQAGQRADRRLPVKHVLQFAQLCIDVCDKLRFKPLAMDMRWNLNNVVAHVRDTKPPAAFVEDLLEKSRDAHAPMFWLSKTISTIVSFIHAFVQMEKSGNSALAEAYDKHLAPVHGLVLRYAFNAAVRMCSVSDEKLHATLDVYRESNWDAARHTASQIDQLFDGDEPPTPPPLLH